MNYPESHHNHLTPQERLEAKILIVDSDTKDRATIRSALSALGYAKGVEAKTHLQALELLNENKFSHIIMDAKETDLSPKEFLEQALKINKRIVCIPAASKLKIDDVFELLTLGAKGFLVKPFTADSFDNSIALASKKDGIGEMMLDIANRNEALATSMITHLNKAALNWEQNTPIKTGQALKKVLSDLQRSSSMAQMFAQGGPGELIESLIACCQKRNPETTRLGKIRKKLRETRL